MIKLKNCLYTSLIIFIFHNLVLAQSIELDSLENLVAQTVNPKFKVDYLIEIADYKIPFGGKEEVTAAISIAKKINYQEGLGEGYYTLGMYYYNKNEIVLAQEHLEIALTIFQTLQDYERQVSVINLLGDNEYFAANYPNALTYFLEAEKIAIKLKDDFLIGETKFFLSRVYFEGLGETDKALHYLQQSLPLLLTRPASHRILDVYMAFCSYYSTLENSDSLEIYIQKLEKATQLDHYSYPYYDAIIKESKGKFYWLKGNFLQAEQWLLSALEEYIKNEDPYVINDTRLFLAELSLDQKAWAKAISYGKASLKFEDLEYKMDAFELIKKAYKHVDMDSFMLYEEKFTVARDSLDELSRLKELQQVVHADNINKKDQEINQQKSNKLYILFSGLFFTLLFGIGLLKFYRRSQRQKIQLALLKAEKNHIRTIFEGNEEELETLRTKVTTIERSLVTSQLNYERQQSTLTNVTQFLRKMVSNEKPENLKKQLRSLSREIESNLNQEDRWELFAKQFEQVHPQFFSLLIQQFPTLNNRDLRLCAYVRLGMDNQEIGNILGIEASSVIKARHRMKKKMNLEKEVSLNQFLLNL